MKYWLMEWIKSTAVGDSINIEGSNGVGGKWHGKVTVIGEGFSCGS